MSTERTDERRRVGQLVALAAAVAFGSVALSRWEPYTFLHGDGAFYANISKTLWTDGSLDQGNTHPRSWLVDNLGWNRDLDQGWSNVSLGADGRWLPKHSFVMPALSLPLYGLFGPGGLLAFHVLMLVLLTVSAYAVAARMVGSGAAAVGALLAMAQPVVTGDIYSFNNDVFYAALLTAGAAAFFASIGMGDEAAPEPRRRAALEWAAGLLLGVGVIAKVTNLVYVVPLGLWLIARWELPSLRRALVAFAIPLALFAVSNTVLFGGPLKTSYGSILVRQNGALTTESVSVKFHEPLKAGLVRITTDEREGLLPRAPLLLTLAVLGAVVLLVRRDTRAFAALFLAVLAVFLAVQAKYAYTYARFFLPLVGLAAAPIVAGLWSVAGALRLGARALRWLRPFTDDRPNPAFAAAAFGGGLLFGVVRWGPERRAWQLVNHAEEAHVAVLSGRPKVCDYFNNQHQKFECGGEGGSEQMWGRAVGKQCTFGGQPRPMLFLHPPVRGPVRSLTIQLPAGDTLGLQYGLADTSRHDDVNFELRIDGQRVELPGVVRKDTLVRHDIEGLAQRSHTLELRVNSPGDWRHFCFNATVSGLP